MIVLFSDTMVARGRPNPLTFECGREPPQPTRDGHEPPMGLFKRHNN